MPIRFIKNDRQTTRALRGTRPVAGPPAPPRPSIKPRLSSSPLWSILVPTIPGRERKLNALCKTLDRQLESRVDVELLVLRDNRGMTIGEKRNRMLALARGRYVSFVDDDDEVGSDYVAAISEKLVAESPDVVCFQLFVDGHGPRKVCRYHPTLKNENLAHEYRRKPNHLMVWRHELAILEPFPALQHGEDTAWANRMVKHAVKVATIDRPLYTYKFDKNDNSGATGVPPTE